MQVYTRCGRHLNIIVAYKFVGLAIAEKLIAPTVFTNIHFLAPEALFQFLETQAAQQASTEQTIKGYRVKVEYNVKPESETEQKKSHILKTVTDSIRKKKK